MWTSWWLSMMAAMVVITRAVNPIIVQGHMFFDSVTKERFYIKGVDYAPDIYGNTAAGGTSKRSPPGVDHITDQLQADWQRDLPILKDLGINAVRIYDVDPAASHDGFMKAAEALGIYVLISATRTTGPGVLNTNLPAPDCYTTGLAVSAKMIVKAFAKYNNTLGVVVGNEISNAVVVQGEGNTAVLGLLSMPCVRALTRDLKAYMKSCSCGMRRLPLFYAATDLGPLKSTQTGATLNVREAISQYLTCGDADSVVDAYGINIYTWCSTSSTFTTASTYSQVTDAYSLYPLPLVYTEFGCNQGSYLSPYPFTTGQREWKQVATILSSKMSDVFSGGLAYQYSMTENDFGLVLLPNYKANQPNVEKLANYNALSTQYKTATPPALTADWTDTNICQWIPPGFSTKRKQTCPAASFVQDIFTAAKIVNHPQNWAGVALPPIPPDSDVPCAEVTLSSGQRQWNSCFGKCGCDNIPSSSGCSSGFNSTTNSSLVANLFNRLCTFLGEWGGKYNSTCLDIAPGAVYGGCTVQQKADYALSAWFEGVSGGRQCCSSLAYSESCSTLSFCSELKRDSICTVDWTGVDQYTKQNFFDEMCRSLGSLTEACTLLGARYPDCTDDAKANHLLALWIQENNNNQAFCCASVGTAISVGQCSGEAAACAAFLPNRLCRVDESVSETGADYKQLFDTLCGLFATQAPPQFANTCNNISTGGPMADCPAIQKADYLLDVWFTQVKGGSECCANLLDPKATTCMAVEVCANIPQNMDCSINQTAEVTAVGSLISAQCGFLIGLPEGTSGRTACDDISDTGIFSQCAPWHKANYILDIWYREVKKGRECCSSLLTSTQCQAVTVGSLLVVTEPTNILAVLSSQADFYVEVKGGVQPYIYQWQREMTNIMGEIDSRLVFPSLSDQDVGKYRCIITDSLGSVVLSRTATVAITRAEDTEPVKKNYSGIIAGVIVGIGALTIAAYLVIKQLKRKSTDENSFWGRFSSRKTTDRHSDAVPFHELRER